MATADKNLKILVVDDSDTTVKHIQGMLKKLDFVNVDTATNGLTAIDLIRTKNYGLVISDWNMEPMSGVQLLREIRARGWKMPFIMITTQVSVERKLEAFAFGATDFLIKPFDIELLQNSIFWALSGAKAPVAGGKA